MTKICVGSDKPRVDVMTMMMIDHDVTVPGILIDLIPKYLENRRNDIRALRDASAKGDFDTIRNIGHKLRGNAGSYGFNYLTDLGANLEDAAILKDASSIQKTVTEYELFMKNVRIKNAPHH